MSRSRASAPQPPDELPAEPEAADAIITAHLQMEGPCLPILHALQDRFGYIPDGVLPRLAKALNISRADLHGVISFYHEFRREPAGRHVLKLCRAEACQSVGADKLAAGLLQDLGLDWHGTTTDGRLTVEPAFCLGLCACGPAALFDNEPQGRLDAPALNALAAQP